jgi:CDP-diacylglycerol--glycerol-3-phosphate 3-phosphatidyltransferase
MMRLSGVRKTLGNYLSEPIVRFLARTPITPNTLTCFGFLVTVGAAVLIGTRHLFAAGFVVLAAGIFDIMDGALARSTNRTTRFGAILDSTLDRAAEAVLLIAILTVYAGEQSVAGVLVTGIVWLGSLLVSYIRARAEALGLDCQVGIFTRPERVVVLALGLLLSQFDNALLIALSIMAVLSLVTAGQRLLSVWQQTRTR